MGKGGTKKGSKDPLADLRSGLRHTRSIWTGLDSKQALAWFVRDGARLMSLILHKPSQQIAKTDRLIAMFIDNQPKFDNQFNKVLKPKGDSRLDKTPTAPQDNTTVEAPQDNMAEVREDLPSRSFESDHADHSPRLSLLVL